MKEIAADMFLVTCPEEKIMWKLLPMTKEYTVPFGSMHPYAFHLLRVQQSITESTWLNLFHYDAATNCYWWSLPCGSVSMFTANLLRLRSFINRAKPDYVVTSPTGDKSCDTLLFEQEDLIVCFPF